MYKKEAQYQILQAIKVVQINATTPSRYESLESCRVAPEWVRLTFPIGIPASYIAAYTHLGGKTNSQGTCKKINVWLPYECYYGPLCRSICTLGFYIALTSLMHALPQYFSTGLTVQYYLIYRRPAVKWAAPNPTWNGPQLEFALSKKRSTLNCWKWYYSKCSAQVYIWMF